MNRGYMNIRKITCLLGITLLLAVCLTLPVSAEDGKALRILFTHDMHDHFLPNKAEADGKLVSTGGFSRLKTAIDQEREHHPGAVLVDGGDYSMGTLFQTMFSSDAPGLRIMGQMGYDAVTLGNHEFDYRDNGLARHLYTAVNSGERLPQIVASNIVFPSEDKMAKELMDLKNSMDTYGVKEYTVIQRNGLKIGIFGLMGKDADDCTPMTGVTFKEISESAEKIVHKLKNVEKADIIICLSHSGTSKIKSASEDELLAEKVPDIDVIVSAHTHTKLEKPITVGKTIIGSCGEYSNYLGVLDLEQDSSGGWKLRNYKLKPITSDIPVDKEIAMTIKKYESTIEENYLSIFNLKYDELLAQTDFSFIPTAEIGAKLKEEPLGNLISDGYIYAVKKAEDSSYETIDVSVVAAGTMRGSFIKGDITVEDAFIASSLGTGPDGMAGYPLISVYLTGRELMDLCEVDASVSPIMSSAQLYMSGIVYTINPNRMIFNRVTEAHLVKTNGTSEKLEENRLYRVVTGLYNAQMLSVVGEKSFGLLSIIPKSKEGKPIIDFEKHIIHDSSDRGKNEVKEWLAIARYLKSFPEVNGTSRVPEYYSTVHGRKVIDNDKSLGAILLNPNRVAIKIYIVAALVLFIIAVLIYSLIKLKKHFRVKKQASLKK